MKSAVVLFCILSTILPASLQAQPNFKVLLIAISVRDIDSTTNWYHKYLGFNLIDKKDFPENKIGITLLENNGIRLELVRHKQSIAADSLIPRLDNPALLQGYGKIAYEVADIDQTVRTMKAEGVKFVYDLRDSATGIFAGYRSCIVLDNNCNWAQLFQRK
jgi:catechol 2,3-dioxygenase-like lactoylglutathione lyase family enzyme